jgi:hypothetical protein
MIENITCKLDNFNFKRYNAYCEEEDDKECVNEEYIKGIAYNKKIYDYHKKLEGKLKYFKQEYEKYINKIGFELHHCTIKSAWRINYAIRYQQLFKIMHAKGVPKACRFKCSLV